MSQNDYGFVNVLLQFAWMRKTLLGIAGGKLQEDKLTAES